MSSNKRGSTVYAMYICKYLHISVLQVIYLTCAVVICLICPHSHSGAQYAM